MTDVVGRGLGSVGRPGGNFVQSLTRQEAQARGLDPLDFVDGRVANAFAVMEAAVGYSLRVTSAWRSDETNAAVRGSQRHPEGTALDVSGFRNDGDRAIAVAAARSAGILSAGAYKDGSIHVDVSPRGGVWGQSRTSRDAPGWLREAFNNPQAVLARAGQDVVKAVNTAIRDTGQAIRTQVQRDADFAEQNMPREAPLPPERPSIDAIPSVGPAQVEAPDAPIDFGQQLEPIAPAAPDIPAMQGVDPYTAPVTSPQQIAELTPALVSPAQFTPAAFPSLDYTVSPLDVTAFNPTIQFAPEGLIPGAALAVGVPAPTPEAPPNIPTLQGVAPDYTPPAPMTFTAPSYDPRVDFSAPFASTPASVPVGIPNAPMVDVPTMQGVAPDYTPSGMPAASSWGNIASATPMDTYAAPSPYTGQDLVGTTWGSPSFADIRTAQQAMTQPSAVPAAPIGMQTYDPVIATTFSAPYYDSPSMRFGIMSEDSVVRDRIESSVRNSGLLPEVGAPLVGFEAPTPAPTLAAPAAPIGAPATFTPAAAPMTPQTVPAPEPVEVEAPEPAAPLPLERPTDMPTTAVPTPMARPSLIPAAAPEMEDDTPPATSTRARSAPPPAPARSTVAGPAGGTIEAPNPVSPTTAADLARAGNLYELASIRDGQAAGLPAGVTGRDAAVAAGMQKGYGGWNDLGFLSSYGPVPTASPQAQAWAEQTLPGNNFSMDNLPNFGGGGLFSGNINTPALVGTIGGGLIGGPLGGIVGGLVGNAYNNSVINANFDALMTNINNWSPWEGTDWAAPAAPNPNATLSDILGNPMNSGGWSFSDNFSWGGMSPGSMGNFASGVTSGIY